MKGGDNIKSLKISSTVPQKAGKVILWVLICFLLLRGIGSIFKKNDSVTAKEVISQYTKESEQKKITELEAEATAQSFVTEYLTYGNSGTNTDDYTNRVKKYMAGNIDSLQNFSNDSKSKVMNTEVTQVKWVSDSQLNIDVRAKVEYTQKVKADSIKQEMTDKTTISDCSLRVPVAVSDGKYAVEDIPAFIPDADKAAIKISPFGGKEMEEAKAKEVKTTLENFFKTYYSGNSTEISYYMADPKEQIPGLNKRFEFQKIDEAKVFTDEKTKGINAVVSLTVKDSINGQAMPQRYNVQLISKDGKLYIESFDVRTGNIK